MSDERKSVLRECFDRSPVWTAVALAMPFGVCFGILAAVLKMPRAKGEVKNATSEKPDSR